MAEQAKKKGVDWGGIAGGVAGLLGGGGLLGGLFGGGNSDAINKARQQQQSALDAEQGGVQHWSDLASNYLGQGEMYGQQANDAIGTLADYFRKDYGTDQRAAEDLRQVTNQANNQYSRQIANNTAEMAARGLDTASSAGPSSVGAGMNAYLQAARTNAIGGAQNDLAYRRIAQRQGQLTDLVNLLTGQRDSFDNKGVGSLQNYVSGQSDISRQYGDRLAALVQSQQQQDAAGLGGIMSIAKSFG